MDRFNNDYAKPCARGDAPFCTDACPFRLDVRDFIGKLQRGSFGAAYKAYRQAVVFPALVKDICDRRCAAVCPRRESDEAVRLRELERAAVSLTADHAPVRYNLPAKSQRVAVVGGGPCGLAFAIRLAAKRYPVTVYEKEERLGGSFLLHLDENQVAAEIELQSQASPYQVELGREILSLDELEEDAVFIATGDGGRDFGCGAGGQRSIHAGNRPGVFLGGRLMGCDLLESIRDGATAAVDVEKYLKLNSTNFEPELVRPTRLVPPAPDTPKPAVEPADGRCYTGEEARAEAARCLKCDCDRCFSACDFMQHFRKYPVQLANAVDFGLRLDVLEPNTNNRMVNSCADCGLCRAACPYDVDSGQQIMLARHQMFEQAQISDAYHEYLLRDMEHALSERAFLARPAPNGHTGYAFFPGCQLTASDREYAVKGFELLLKAQPDSGLLLACCGAPAYWAGDEELRQKVDARLLSAWEELGRPTLVLACASCGRQLGRALPQIPWVDLWSLLKELPPAAYRGRFALADPCSAQSDPAWHEDVTAVLDKLGVDYEPLYDETGQAACCGYGGDIEGALPELKEKMAARRLELSPLPYLCYCANCRDIYTNRGKEAWHLLDLFLDRTDPRPAPDLTCRRRNREEGRSILLKRFWGEDAPAPEPENAHIRLDISPDIRAVLDRERLTEDDLRRVLDYAERTGLWFEDESGLRIAHLDLGVITVWLEYREADGVFIPEKVYRHRMKIEEAGREIKRSTKRLPHYVRT
ncbi:MAG: NAD(P)-binding protein [Firmicutes bacterium]|nr:NAD(P)-binding protein [Bacillota bacterium]